MGFFKRLLTRLRFGRTDVALKREWPPQFFNLSLSRLYDVYRDALPGSPTKALTRAELANRAAQLKEWVDIYMRSPTDDWAEDLSLRRIQKADATDEEWHWVFLNSPKNGLLNRIARKKMK